jgi:hypothetical protein
MGSISIRRIGEEHVMCERSVYMLKNIFMIAANLFTLRLANGSLVNGAALSRAAASLSRAVQPLHQHRACSRIT